jgi:hypothetical protein
MQEMTVELDRAGNRVEFIGPPSRPLVIRRYDAKGRHVQSTGWMTDGATQQKFTFDETAEWNEDSSLKRMQERRDGKVTVVREFQVAPTADGGTEWVTSGGMKGFKETRYTFSHKGEMTLFQMIREQGPAHQYVLTRNDRGDVASYKSGPPFGDLTEYEYEYDAAGNWVVRRTFRTTRNERKLYQTEWREIAYRKSVADPAKPDLAKVAGVYVREMSDKAADPGAREFKNTMTVDLRADGIAFLHTKTLFNGELIEKEAKGAWSLERGKVVLKLALGLRGPAVPPNAPPLSFSPATDGKALAGPSGEFDYVRVDGK